MNETAAPPKTAPVAHTAAEFVRKELAAGKKPNRLLDEKSPYLLQHAFNPVDWHPWGEEAFAQARQEDKPVFLSVGYSTCHWCHVMAHESFESEEIAALMNRYFVCIKVDREERPDVDQVYMAATQAMTGAGGWPMSVFMTPEGKPFFTGTYFPPRSHFGLPGFGELLEKLGYAWQADRDKVEEIAAQVAVTLQTGERRRATDQELTEKVLEKGYRQISASFDKTHGGFGTDPKFPRPVTLNLLLRYYYRTREAAAREMVLFTLQKMAAGGVYDHLGGGFHRYGVDREWRVPHFEKMLYDQAQLAISYLEAFQLTGNSVYGQVARDVLDYVRRDLTGPEGGFYSAEDADSPQPEDPSQQAEGAFYLWTVGELEELFPPAEAQVIAHYYGLRPEGNAPVDPHQEFTGKNILYLAHSVAETAGHFDRSAQEVAGLLAEARWKLLEVRGKRPRPHLDDKVITAWNGLMISAFARGSRVLAEARYRIAAENGADFLLRTLYDPGNRVLRRRYRDGEAGQEAHLDDYAFLVQGLLDLYENTLEIRWLQQAEELTARQIELFADEAQGGFFDTAGQDSTLLVRMKSDYDGAEPAANSIAALNLLRLALMTGQETWQERAAKTIAVFGERLRKETAVLPQMAVALDFKLGPVQQIVIAGRPGAEDTEALLQEVHRRFLPRRVLLLADGGHGQEWLAARLPFMAEMEAASDRAAAHLCRNFRCQLPFTEPLELGRALAE